MSAFDPKRTLAHHLDSVKAGAERCQDAATREAAKLRIAQLALGHGVTAIGEILGFAPQIMFAGEKSFSFRFENNPTTISTLVH